MSSPVTIEPTALDGVYYVQRAVHGDERGQFTELWNQAEFERAGWTGTFLQDCLSRSRKGVLRGLHIQEPAQAKLIALLEGRTVHAAIDLRPDSPGFGQHILCPLDAEEPRALLIAEGFAHGFVAQEDCLMLYKCSELHSPGREWSLKWNDPELAIDWPLEGGPLLSPRDQTGLSLGEFKSLR
ncbi:MAG: dTDP-4-dehydrorhamnose 3,5-epimerase [Candidatus Eremiobacteraeota bacterium]|nr:dTDP-4-dehydrorhamnose 3,5-epimerase [Candidatus Eremiobacteraeota bacterium]